MYFKSNCSLVETSGMMHLQLYFKTDKNSIIFSISLIFAQTKESLLLVFHSVYSFLSYLFGSKETTCFYSFFLSLSLSP